VNELVYSEVTVMNKLSLAHFALIRPLFEMGALVSAQTLHPREALTTNITAMRFLSCVDVLMPPEITEIFETETTAVANVGLFASVYTFVYLKVLLLSEPFAAAITFIRSLTSMDIVVNFKMRYMRKHSTAYLALIEFLLARLDSTVGGVDLHILVDMFAVTFLVDHVVPISLETFTAHLALERFILASVRHLVDSQSLLVIETFAALLTFVC